MKTKFYAALETVPTGEEIVTISWITDRVMTFGDEMAFENPEDFVEMLKASMRLATRSGLLSASDSEYLRMMLDKTI